MKKIIATAIVLAAATPALANDQLARSLGVAPGQYTTAELAILKAQSTKTGNEGRVFLDNTRFAQSRSVHNPVAMMQFDRAVEENREGGN